MSSPVCPTCGTVASPEATTCARCQSSLALPAGLESREVPVLRAPTHRGEEVQRREGVETTVLAKASVPQESTYSKIYGKGGREATRVPEQQTTTPAPPSGWGSQQWSPPDPGNRVTAPPPEHAHGSGWTNHAPAGAAPAQAQRRASDSGWEQSAITGSAHSDQHSYVAPADVPSPAGNPSPAANPKPAVSERTAEKDSQVEGNRADEGEGRNEARPRPGRPDGATWPPPPGPWSGHRTTET